MRTFERSKLTAKLVTYLMPLDKGTEISYGTISAAVGNAITAQTPALRSALNILSRDESAVWRCVRPGVGLRRLTDKEIVESTQPRFIGGARRKLKRGEMDVNNVDSRNLTLNEQAKMAVATIQIHAGLNTLSRDTRKRLENVAARGNANDLPKFNIADLAQSLMKGKKKTIDDDKEPV